MTIGVLDGWRFRALLLIVALSVLGYLGFSLWGGWQDVLAAVGRVGPGGMAVALALSLVNYGMRFVRWQKFLELLGHRVHAPESLRIYIGGFGLTILPGKVGETIRSVMLKRHGMSYPESLAAFLSDQFSNVISMLMLVVLGMSAYPKALPMVLVLSVLIVVMLLVLQQRRLLQTLQRIAQVRLPTRLGNLLSHVIDIVLHSGRCFNLPMLVYSFLLGIVAWGAEGVAFYYVVNLLDGDISLRVALFIYAFSMLVGAFSFMPGGLGGAEASMVALLMLNNVGQAEAVATTVLVRLATLWFAVGLGMVALAMPERKSGPV